MLGQIIVTSHFFCHPFRLNIFLCSQFLNSIPSCCEVARKLRVRSSYLLTITDSLALEYCTLAAARTAKDRPDGTAAPHAQ